MKRYTYVACCLACTFYFYNLRTMDPEKELERHATLLQKLQEEKDLTASQHEELELTKSFLAEEENFFYQLSLLLERKNYLDAKNMLVDKTAEYIIEYNATGKKHPKLKQCADWYYAELQKVEAVLERKTAAASLIPSRITYQRQREKMDTKKRRIQRHQKLLENKLVDLSNSMSDCFNQELDGSYVVVTAPS